MRNRGILSMSEDQFDDFGSTKRQGLWPLSDHKGRHAHNEAHAALSDYINEKHGTSMRRGAQRGADWEQYLERRGTLRKVLNDLDDFYEDWLPRQVGKGLYSLLRGQMDAARAAYGADRSRIGRCKG